MTDAQVNPEDSTTPDGEGLLQEVFDLWVLPAVLERGLDLTPLDIRKAIVEMEPDKPIRVLINEEAQINGWAKARRDITAGEELTSDDIEDLKALEPVGVGADSGWVCFVRIGDRAFVAFDLTYNRERANALVAKARRFLAVAQEAFGRGDWDVAIDTGYSAAELTIQAQMLIMQANTKKHTDRGRWIRSWAEMDNSPKLHADTYWTLHSLRNPARYGVDDAHSMVENATLKNALRTVVEMIEIAAQRVQRPQRSAE